MKIIAFAASSSTKSINKKLVTYATSLIKEATIEILDLNDYELPLYSEDKEIEIGQQELAQKFVNKIKECDAIIVSFAEHNGSYSVAYRNIIDWSTRITPQIYQKKPMVLLATSPGETGASTVLATAISSMPFFEGVLKGSFSLPSFNENFDIENNVITNEELIIKLKKELKTISL